MTTSRRSFLASAAVGTAVPMSAASASRVLGANDRIRLGLIGCGGMGRGDLTDMLRAGKTEAVALCDIDKSQMARTQERVVAPFDQTAELQTQDFRRVLERNDIDAVIVATPDHWHAIPTVEACKAGMDVYIEKPLAMTVWEGRQMVDAARKYDRVVQMGTQQRSGAQYRDAKEYVDSGKLGRVRYAVLGPTRRKRTRLCGRTAPTRGYDLLGPRQRSVTTNRFSSSSDVLRLFGACDRWEPT